MLAVVHAHTGDPSFHKDRLASAYTRIHVVLASTKTILAVVHIHTHTPHTHTYTHTHTHTGGPSFHQNGLASAKHTHAQVVLTSTKTN